MSQYLSAAKSSLSTAKTPAITCPSVWYHRCMGNRVAELQLRVLWEEIMKRFDNVEVVGEPTRTFSSFVRGYTDLTVRVHKRA